MSVSRKIVALVAPLMLLGGFSVLGAQSASARATTHKIFLKGNMNVFAVATPALEPRARVYFTCNSTTGVYTLRVKNVSVIGGDQMVMVSPFSHQPRRMTILVGLPVNEEFDVTLAQNTATSLYDADVTNMLSDRADCASGVVWGTQMANASDFQGSYNVVGHLS
jgi:hypothetical protein